MDGLIRDFHQTLRRTQFLPPDRLRDYQRGLLERLLRHTRQHVPFYRDSGRLDALFGPADRIDWARWNDIPPLTRRDLQSHGDKLRSEWLPPEHGATTKFETSGTTGEPVIVWHCDIAKGVAWTALQLRDLENHRIDPAGRLAYLDPFSPDEDTRPQRHENWYSAFGLLGLKGERIDVPDSRPADELVDIVADLRPDCLRVQPVSLELLRAHDRRRRLADCGIKAAIAIGESFSEGAKPEIEKHFGCRIVEMYSSNECGKIATSCPECGRFHVHAETILAEFIGENGSPAAAGETGRVLATPLYNYAMPLIRYDHGDFARLGAAAACSVTLPALDEVIGKERTAFVFADGTAIRPSVPSNSMVELLGARAFQFAQIAPDRCEVRFVPGHLTQDEMRFDEMTRVLRAVWWPRIEVDYRIVDALPQPRPRAKVPLVVREMAPDQI